MRIDANETYFAGFNRFEITLPGQAVIDCSRSGPVDDAVAYWAPRIPNEVDPAAIRAELTEYGTWDDIELSDDAENWARLVWIAAGNISEDNG
jgi:hypothetical protein